jgi:hypothetical protein
MRPSLSNISVIREMASFSETKFAYVTVKYQCQGTGIPGITASAAMF